MHWLSMGRYHNIGLARTRVAIVIGSFVLCSHDMNDSTRYLLLPKRHCAGDGARLICLR